MSRPRTTVHLQAVAAALVVTIAVAVRAEPIPTTMGTKHPMLVQRVAPDGHWAFVCQAREDTDHDGKVEIEVAYHGETSGDRLVPYFIRSSGKETVIEDLVSS